MLQARRELQEYGALPLHALCPQLDSQAALTALNLRLLAKSTVGAHNGASECTRFSSLHARQFEPRFCQVLGQDYICDHRPRNVL